MTMTKLSFLDFMQNSGVVGVEEIPWANKVFLPSFITPFPHQYSGTNLLCMHERAGIYDQTGTGKSMSIQAFATYRAGLGDGVIGLMPPILLTQFLESINDTFLGISNHLDIQVLPSKKAIREKLLAKYREEGFPNILLMTYNLFKGTATSQGLDLELKANGYNVIIADEAQALRNSSSSIHKKVYRYIGGKKDNAGKFRLVLSTGTPSHTHLEQNYGLIRLITPNAYGSKSSYERLHVIKNYNSPFKEVLGYDNLDVMIINLYARARRVEKADVAKDLPPKIHTVVPIELDKAHKKLYKQLLNDRLLELDDEFIDATQAQALRQVALQLVSDPNRFSDRKIKNNMEEALLQLLGNIDLAATKVLVFIHFNNTADRLMDLLKEYNPALLNGKITNKDREIEKFQEDESCRVLVAHTASAGAGLNFQKQSSDVIFYECPDSSGDLTQAEDRVHRITGTKGTVNVYFLAALGTWAEKKIKQVIKKDGIINQVVGDKKALLSDLYE